MRLQERLPPRSGLRQLLDGITVSARLKFRGINAGSRAMFLNLNDAESILSWWSVFPARHDAALEQMLLSRPQFGQSIRAAQRRIRASDDLQVLLNKSLAQQDEHMAQMSERRAAMSSVEMLRRDLAIEA